MYRVLFCLTGAHDYALVALAALLAALTGFSVFATLRRARNASEIRGVVWTLVAAFITGAGVFSTHFVAMLAYDPGQPVSYAVTPSVLSFLLGAAVGGVGYGVWIFAPRNWISLTAGAAFLGGGLSLLHYVGMSAIEISARLSWDWDLVTASVLFCVLISLVVGHFSVHVRARDRLAQYSFAIGPGALILSVVTLHFTGMGAVNYMPDITVAGPEADAPTTWLIVVVSVAAITVALIGAVAAFADRLFHRYSERMRARHVAFADASFEALILHDGDTVHEVNGKAREMFGEEGRGPVGLPLSECFRCEDGAGAIGDTAFSRTRLSDRFGAAPVEIKTRSLGSDENLFVTAIRDLREREADRARIEALATRDPVTGLARRSTFVERVEDVLPGAIEREEMCAIVRIRIRRFSQVSEWAGFEAADHLLAKISERIQAAFPHDALGARLSDEDIAFLLLEFDGDVDIETRLRAVQRRLATPIHLNDRSYTPELAFGVALSPEDGTSAETLLANATSALEAGGKDRIRFHHSGLSERRRARFEIEARLAEGLTRDEFRLVYQPQACLRTGRVTGVEALVRWRTADGDISPADFIPVAEESGLINPLGRRILQLARRDTSHWPEEISVAVNLSPVQFSDPHLLETLRSEIEVGHLDPKRFKLEITEGAVIEDTRRSQALLNELSDLGFRLALDDFGTGYSSLAYLREFPFDQIKIDRAFVTGIDSDPDKARLLNAIIQLGAALDLETLAEGAETESEIETLRALDCHEVQGYGLARPMPATSIPDFLAEHLKSFAGRRPVVSSNRRRRSAAG